MCADGSSPVASSSVPALATGVPRASLTSTCTQVSCASTTPPGKRWPTRSFRTTTSMMSGCPGFTGAPSAGSVLVPSAAVIAATSMLAAPRSMSASASS
jgi:hypothetical protein